MRRQLGRQDRRRRKGAGKEARARLFLRREPRCLTAFADGYDLHQDADEDRTPIW